MSVNITFLGGSGTVTGSKYLLRHDGKCVLVDCGLFQGYKQLRLRNWTPLPIAPKQVDVVLLTHAHLDHSGYLPLLAKEGFEGHVYATRGTRDLCKILLPDSGHIQEEDAAFANRHGFSKHAPALPLYTRQDALDALPLIKAVDFNKTITPMPGWKATFSSAGHILGASSILLEVAGRRILFSGDLGRPDDLIMSPPAPAPQAASAHADANQLLAWLRTMPQPPDQVYVVHGEPGPADTLRRRIKHELGWRAVVPEHGSTWPT